MKGLLVATAALFMIGFSQETQAYEDVKPANGRFYCQGIFNPNIRMDVDFFGTSASLEIYDAKSGEYTRRHGSFDDFRSSFTTTQYRVSPLANIQFPARYESMHWFQLTYSDSYGWIHFDCNHF